MGAHHFRTFRVTSLREITGAILAHAHRALSVAQTSSLLYRGFPIRRSWPELDASEGPEICRLEVGDTAGWKPALRPLPLKRQCSETALVPTS